MTVSVCTYQSVWLRNKATQTGNAKTVPIVFVVLSPGSGGDWALLGISHLGLCGDSLMVARARVL